MPKKTGDKLKILLIKDYLTELSDEDHPISVAQIIDRLLDDYAIEAERKSIYRDLKLLGRKELSDDDDENSDDDFVQSYGMDIRRKNKMYYLGERAFTLQEIKLLVDMVESSSNIPYSTAKQLLEKLRGQVSVHNRRHLERHVDIRNQVKTLNEQFQKNADVVFDAMNNDYNIVFQYFSYDINKKKSLRNKGKSYSVSPFALVWVDQNYYMIGYNLELHGIRTYRVDRMTRVMTISGPRSGKQEYEKLVSGNLSSYINKVFHMYIGEVKLVTMRFDRALIDTVIDRFGEDVMLHPDGEKHFTVTTEVAVSPQFRGWLAGFGPMAELVAPRDEREEMIRQLQETMQLYK